MNGDPSGTYNITIMSNEKFVLVSKIIGVFMCLVSYFFILRPRVF